MRKMLPLWMICVLLLAACGQSYEETKRHNRQQREDAQRRDSAALKIAVMPTLDCLPLYVARHYQLLDTLRGGVRLKYYTAQMDCDTAFERGRVEGMVTDLVRAARIAGRGTKVRYVAATNAYWLLVTNRNARIRQPRQLTDKMVAMTRYSATDLLTDGMVERAHMDGEHLFKLQVNDVNVRLQMLQNNEIDALWLTEPQATMALQYRHVAIDDSRRAGVRLGVLAFREQEMRHPERASQLALLVKAYDQACDSINKHGVRYYGSLIADYCRVRPEVADSLPADLRYEHARGPRQQDVEAAEQWLRKQGIPTGKKQ
ncbi:MAG: ABC transporter substrate-binding protein [Prevotella sp.]|nr:ABC transporter substrate-binding protein [Prevotella sp.]